MPFLGHEHLFDVSRRRARRVIVEPLVAPPREQGCSARGNLANPTCALGVVMSSSAMMCAHFSYRPRPSLSRAGADALRGIASASVVVVRVVALDEETRCQGETAGRARRCGSQRRRRRRSSSGTKPPLSQRRQHGHARERSLRSIAAQIPGAAWTSAFADFFAGLRQALGGVGYRFL
jgi:hypothetical protein